MNRKITFSRFVTILIIALTQVFLCNTDTTKNKVKIHRGYDSITKLKLSENNRYVLFFLNDLLDRSAVKIFDSIYVYDIVTKKTVKLKTPKEEFCCALFAEADSRVIILTAKGTMRIYEVSNWGSYKEVVFNIEKNNFIYKLTYHKNGLLALLEENKDNDPHSFFIYDLTKARIVNRLLVDRKYHLYRNFQIFEDKIGIRLENNIEFMNFKGERTKTEFSIDSLPSNFFSNSEFMVFPDLTGDSILFWNNSTKEFKTIPIAKKLNYLKLTREGMFLADSASGSDLPPKN